MTFVKPTMVSNPLALRIVRRMACQLSQSSPVNVTLGNFAENTEQLSFLMDVKEEVCGIGTVGNCLETTG